MTPSLWRHQVLPFVFSIGLLAAATLAGDILLHRLNLAWIGRTLGIPGTILIAGSMLYSLRKRKYISAGNPKALLTLHESGAWLGSLMVLIHAGAHFNAILPWLATAAMSVNVVSGMVGKVLLDRSRRYVLKQREQLQLRGLPPEEIERAVFWDAVALDVMTQWRRVHIPIFFAFAVLLAGHIISVFLFWGWV